MTRTQLAIVLSLGFAANSATITAMVYVTSQRTFGLDPLRRRIVWIPAAVLWLTLLIILAVILL